MSDDYPKRIEVDGRFVVVKDEVDEAMWRGEYKPPQGAAARTDPDHEEMTK